MKNQKKFAALTAAIAMGVMGCKTHDSALPTDARQTTTTQDQAKTDQQTTTTPLWVSYNKAEDAGLSGVAADGVNGVLAALNSDKIKTYMSRSKQFNALIDETGINVREPGSNLEAISSLIAARPPSDQSNESDPAAFREYSDINEENFDLHEWHVDQAVAFTDPESNNDIVTLIGMSYDHSKYKTTIQTNWVDGKMYAGNLAHISDENGNFVAHFTAEFAVETDEQGSPTGIPPLISGYFEDEPGEGYWYGSKLLDGFKRSTDVGDYRAYISNDLAYIDEISKLDNRSIGYTAETDGVCTESRCGQISLYGELAVKAKIVKVNGEYRIAKVQDFSGT